MPGELELTYYAVEHPPFAYYVVAVVVVVFLALQPIVVVFSQPNSGL